MRSLKRHKRSAHDPAPSRLAYKLERLRLTPGYRGFLRIGVPVLAVAGVIGFLTTDERAQAHIDYGVSEMRRIIEERPEFAVHLMAIDGASRELADDIREVLPYDFPISSFDLDLEEMRQAVMELDPVAQADIRIRSGGVLQIEVQERLPAIVWRGPQGVETLDAEGHRVGALIARAERRDLPLITGVGADMAVPEALQLFAVATPLSEHVRGLVRMGERRWDMVLDREQRILLPENDPISALQRVIALHQAEDLFSRDVTAIDMRLGQRPTIRLAENAITELWRIRGYSVGDGSK